jgi:hypothetical protein
MALSMISLIAFGTGRRDANMTSTGQDASEESSVVLRQGERPTVEAGQGKGH